MTRFRSPTMHALRFHTSVIMLVVFTTAAGAQEPPVNVSIQGNALPREDVLRAVEVFKRNCSPLNRYWADIEAINVAVREEFAAYRLAKGWKATIHVTIAVPDNPRLIPKADGRIGVIAGHTLHYNLGGGAEPGMFGSKRVSQMLCGMPISDRGD